MANGLILLAILFLVFCFLYAYEVKVNDLLCWKKEEKEAALKKGDMYKLVGILIGKMGSE